jgi:hypothetical protein
MNLLFCMGKSEFCRVKIDEKAYIEEWIFSFLLKRNSSSSTCWTMFCNFLHIIRHKNGVWHKRNSLISSFSFYVPEISKWKVEIILIYFSYGLFMVECWFDFKVEK